MHGVFSVISGASGVKIWHSPRTGMEKGSEEGRGRGMERWGRKIQLKNSSPSWIGQQYIIHMPEPEQRRHAVSTNVSR
jgi:hypothetical protein